MSEKDACCDAPEDEKKRDGHGHGRKEFLEVVSPAEASARWLEALKPGPLGTEEVGLADAHGRILGAPFVAPIDLPPFDRALVDGFALRAADTAEASESRPGVLFVDRGAIAAGDDPTGRRVEQGRCVEIATGGVLPAGADAVVMVEHTRRSNDGNDPTSDHVLLAEPLVPGQGVGRRGSDVEQGERLFEAGRRLGARETGVIAGLGVDRVTVFRRPRVAVISTGDELVAPGGGPLRTGQIYDANARLVADAVRELGGVPVELGIAKDDRAALEAVVARARGCDAIVFSGGTSKGTGDLTHRLVETGGAPGVVVHGVAIRPGKPLVLAAWGRTPVVILPGFPTSAAITFLRFVAPVLRLLAGQPPAETAPAATARLGVSTPCAPGRLDVVLCHVVDGGDGPPRAFPLLKGSGAVTALARADGWIEVPAGRDQVMAGTPLALTWLDPGLPGSPPRAAGLLLVGEPSPVADALLARAASLRPRFVAASAAAAVDAVKDGLADGAVLGPAGAAEARAAGLALRPLGVRPLVAVGKAIEAGARVARPRRGDLRVALDRALPRDAVTLDVGTPRAALRAVASGAADATLAFADEVPPGVVTRPLAELEVSLVTVPDGAARLFAVLDGNSA